MKSSMRRRYKWLYRASHVLFVVLGLALFIQDSDARRLGGGKSFGRQSQNVTRQQTSPPPQQPAQGTAASPSQPPPAAPQPAGNRWMGALGGLAAGLGISALLSHFGLMGPFASALGSVFMIGLLILAGIVLWRLFAARGSTPPLNRAGPVFPQRPDPALQSTASGSSANVYGAPLRETSPAAPPVDSTWSVPADFDKEAFLRSAKVYFMRLQAAWDAKDFNDIRSFTTPEVFAEIKMQQDEGKGKADKTDIELLDAALLGIETTATEYLASVRFSGRMREDAGNPESFEEIWNLTKPTDGRSGWLLAGIQQVH
jgi:predicted lipid-binding transport protein (Tim44 family)